MHILPMLFATFLMMNVRGMAQEGPATRTEGRSMNLSFMGSVFMPYCDVVVGSYPNGGVGIGYGIGFGQGGWIQEHASLFRETSVVLPVTVCFNYESGDRMNVGLCFRYGPGGRGRGPGSGVLPYFEYLFPITDSLRIGFETRIVLSGVSIVMTF